MVHQLLWLQACKSMGHQLLWLQTKALFIDYSDCKQAHLKAVFINCIIYTHEYGSSIALTASMQEHGSSIALTANKSTVHRLLWLQARALKSSVHQLHYLHARVWFINCSDCKHARAWVINWSSCKQERCSSTALTAKRAGFIRCSDCKKSMVHQLLWLQVRTLLVDCGQEHSSSTALTASKSTLHQLL